MTHNYGFDKGFLQEKYLNIDDIFDKSIKPFAKVILTNYYSLFRPNQMFIAKIDFGNKEFKINNIDEFLNYFKKFIGLEIEFYIVINL